MPGATRRLAGLSAAASRSAWYGWGRTRTDSSEVDQWPSGHEQSAKAVAATIIDWVATIPELNETMIDGLFSALGTANNYFSAEAAANRIAKLSNLTDAQWDQLRICTGAPIRSATESCRNRALEPFYQLRGKEFPPPKPTPPAPPHDPWDPTTTSRRSSDRTYCLLCYG